MESFSLKNIMVECTIYTAKVAVPAFTSKAKEGLEYDRDDEILIPSHLTCEWQPANRHRPKSHGASIRAAGLVDSRSLADLSTSGRRIKVHAHAVVKIPSAELHRGDALWIGPQPKTMGQSRPRGGRGGGGGGRPRQKPIPVQKICVLNLRNGAVGFIGTNDALFVPHVVVRHDTRFFASDGINENAVNQAGDYLTIGDQYWPLPNSTQIITFAINPRTGSFGFVTLSAVRDILDEEIEDWHLKHILPEIKCLPETIPSVPPQDLSSLVLRASILARECQQEQTLELAKHHRPNLPSNSQDYGKKRLLELDYIKELKSRGGFYNEEERRRFWSQFPDEQCSREV